MGKHFTKKYLLSIIYTGRTIAAIAFIMLPITPTSVVVFSIVMGSLWLATVPLTSGIIGYYADVDMQVTSAAERELFAVSSESFISS